MKTEKAQKSVALNFYFKVKVVKGTFTLKVGVLHFQFAL